LPLYNGEEILKGTPWVGKGTTPSLPKSCVLKTRVRCSQKLGRMVLAVPKEFLAASILKFPSLLPTVYNPRAFFKEVSQTTREPKTSCENS